MREVHRHRIIKDGDREIKVRLYQNENEIISGMNISLESIAIIRRLLKGLEYDVFATSRPIQDRCAINFQIIGNQMGMLDDSLKSNEAMQTAYNARSVIAHWYGTPRFNTETMWNDLNADLDFLESGCREVIAAVESGEIVVCDNRKRTRRKLFRR